MREKPTYEDLEKEGIVLKREEGRSQHQTEFLELILESLPYPFYVIDVFDYTIKMANYAAYPGNLPKGITCFALTHNRNSPCNTSDHPCPLEIIKKTKHPVVVEHLHYNSDGDQINVEVNAFPVFDNEGNVSQIIEYCLDISQRKQALACLEDAVSWADPAWEAHFAAGWMLLDAELPTLAAGHFAEAGHAKPYASIAWLCLGDCFRALRLYDQALFYYQRVTELEPTHDLALKRQKECSPKLFGLMRVFNRNALRKRWNERSE